MRRQHQRFRSRKLTLGSLVVPRSKWVGVLGFTADSSGGCRRGSCGRAQKLTNDITLSAEWDGGLGALVATDGSMTQTNAESLVNSMYLNLFERAATAADKAYWSAVVSGATTASEMAIQLIQGAKANRDTTDASVLGYKQEAATSMFTTCGRMNSRRHRPKML